MSDSGLKGNEEKIMVVVGKLLRNEKTMNALLNERDKWVRLETTKEIKKYKECIRAIKEYLFDNVTSEGIESDNPKEIAFHINNIIDLGIEE